MSRRTTSVLVAMVGTAVAAAAAATHVVAVGATTTADVVPLIRCHTSFGVPPGKPAAFPSSTTLAIDTPLAKSLGAYTDTQGYMTIVAPRGWRCSANYGADGSGGVSVYPGHSLATSGGKAIVGSETSACNGCTVAQAASLFPEAAKLCRPTFGSQCHRRPRGELIDSLSSTLVAFEDPAYVKGDGDPSGGRFPTNGVMTYIPGSDDGSYLETCTLPDNVHSTCTAVLNDFIARYRNR